MELPDEDNHCRLTRAFIERFGGSYEDALNRLGNLSLHLICGTEIVSSRALQAALVTAINSGKRAFLGGVTVTMPSGVPSLLPWPVSQTLNEIAVELGAQLICFPAQKPSQTLIFGNVIPGAFGEDDLSIIVSGWRGGIAPVSSRFQLPPGPDHPLAGVLAGALGVARGFLQVSGLSTKYVTSPFGISLWKPNGDWLEKDAVGPTLAYLPKHLWVLGLGHLGQAFLWNLGMLPFKNSAEALIVLQDYDKAVRANRSAGLLFEEKSAGVLKTRLCANWLEVRGFETRLIERKFDEALRLDDSEKFVAFCGFDKALPRTHLETPGFACIVECGLGETAADFDQIDFHTFPSPPITARSLWATQPDEQKPEPNTNLLRAFQQPGLPCGVLGEILANKSLSSAFVGAFAGALALGEILRGLHGGESCEAARYQLRSNSAPQNIMISTRLSILAACGFIPAL